MDPLSELVKIDPKSIGVGQYQHDVAQDRLRDRLDQTVLSAVNKVGVNLNTAGFHLMQYVSGVGPQLAKKIVQFRNKSGGFSSRKELMKVPGLGPKAYQQSAGFLRIKEGSNPLDQSGVHPERYKLVHQMAVDLGVTIEELIQNSPLISQIELRRYVQDEVGLPTLNDIIKELKKPGLDPRGEAEAMVFDEKVKTFEDLHTGMTLQGKITNLTKFGAFVDIGIKENGLVHISQIVDRYISDPSEVLHLDEVVKVKIIGLDATRKRIQLTMKSVN